MSSLYCTFWTLLSLDRRIETGPRRLSPIGDAYARSVARLPAREQDEDGRLAPERDLDLILSPHSSRRACSDVCTRIEPLRPRLGDSRRAAPRSKRRSRRRGSCESSQFCSCGPPDARGRPFETCTRGWYPLRAALERVGSPLWARGGGGGGEGCSLARQRCFPSACKALGRQLETAGSKARG